jgi:uncharacterized membrane protein
MAPWRVAALAAGAVAFALGSTWMMAHRPDHPATVALLFGPLVAAVGVAGWRRRHLPTIAACAALAALLAFVSLRGGAVGAERLYVLQHAAIHATLAWAFGITLRPGATPLVTALAMRLHDDFPPAMREYTRRVTALWAGYFVAMVGVSLALWQFASWATWSLYCTVVTPVAAAALFAAEYAWRYRRHPEFERRTMAQALRAWRARGAR